MRKEFYVVKFGEKYYKEMIVDRGTTRLILVDDLASALWYKNLGQGTIQRLLDLGGSVFAVNVWEFNHTLSLMGEWEVEDNEWEN